MTIQVLAGRNRVARVAGLGYLVLIISGIFGMVYVPAVIFNWDNAAQTAQNLIDNALLFRLGVTSSLLSYIAFALISVLLYPLLSQFARLPALFMLCFAGIGTAAYIANALTYIEITTLLSNTPETGTPGPTILRLAANFNSGFTFIQATTGFWLVALGILAYKSQLLPKLLGVLLIYSGIVNYIGEFLAKFVLEKDIPLLISMPGTVGEFATCLWLLVLGATWMTRERT